MSLERSGMHRAIPIAATCSVALHLTALALSQYLFDGSADPAIAGRVLVLEMDLSPTAQNVESELPFDDAARSDPPSGPETAVSGGSADAAVEVRASEPNLTTPDTVAEGAPEEVVVSDADANGESVASSAEPAAEEPRMEEESGQAGEQYLATASASAQSVSDAPVALSPVAESEPVSPRQVEMLERKVQKWTGKLD